MRGGQTDVALVVCSLDEYADVWPDFFSLWFRFWPDTPFPMYLVTNSRRFPDTRVTSILAGEGLTWSQRMKVALETISQPYVLFSTEDFFLSDTVDTAHVLDLFRQMREEQAVYLRLFPGFIPYTPHPTRLELGVIEKGTPYRSAGQLSFWNRQVMLGSLRDDEGAAEWERQGTARSDASDAPFLCVRDGVEPVKYHNMIRGGKWNRDAIRNYRAHGIPLQLSNRPVQSRFDIWWHTPSPTRRALSTCKHVALKAIGRR
jgi:hypothetical protein